MKRLFEIKADLEQIIQAIEDNDGEITEELQDAYINSQDELSDKSEAYAYVIKEKEGKIATLADEIKRLQALKKKEERDIERLKYYLADAVERFGKYEAGFFKFSIRESQVVDILEPAALSDEYLRVKYEPNKEAIKKVLSTGGVVNGAVLVTNKNLQIK